MSERGPFRTSEPTEEARRARANAESLARVAALTARAIEGERRARERGDAVGVLTLIGAVLAFGACISLAMVDPRGPWAALMCPAFALLISVGLAVGHRAGRRRPRRFLGPRRVEP